MQSIKFNKKIYTLEAVEKAIEEFKNLADFSLKEAGNYIEVKMDKTDKEVKNILSDEFANYVLGLMS
ncbi:MAG TPA: hypothetical protein ENN28_01470 [Candidatus Uhrbacteria bacterium]|nr:hypothetical protein [Candidatus Uhrbacteria bacterium]